MPYYSLVADTKTLTQAEDVERSTITFPDGLWTRARQWGLKLKTPGSQIVVDGLRAELDRLDKAEAQKKAS